MTPCMGGWCVKRDQCPHYHATASHEEPRHRLCLPGEDGIRLVDSTEFRSIRINIFSNRKEELVVETQ